MTKYFKPDTDLRAAYGGAAIVTAEGTNINPYTATHRHIFKNVNFQENRTTYLCRLGQDSSDDWWFKVSDNLYTAISAYLSTAELATVQSSAPTGFGDRTAQAEYQPWANDKTSIIIQGDSMSVGVGTTSGKPDDSVWGQAIADLDTNFEYTAPSDTRKWGNGDNYAAAWIANGSSSWANTVAPNNTFLYREDLRYNQQTKTLPLTYGGNHIFAYWLGSNDHAYDAGLSGADCWTRASTRIAAFVTDHPNAKLIVATSIKRLEEDALNDRINDYNVLMRANYATAGAHVLCDFEAVPEFNIITGNTANADYYVQGGDQTHPTTAGNTLLKPTAKTAILAAKALL